VELDLLWAEEFDGARGVPPTATRWGFDSGDGSGAGIPGWGNAERQFYLETAAKLDGASALHIQARRNVPSPIDGDGPACYYGPSAEWTSARLTTRGKVTMRYGRIVVRARFPFGRGTWPAIWMLGDIIADQGWPTCGEIDIAEGRGSDPSQLFGTLHGPGYSADEGIAATCDLVTPIASDFHDFGIDWLPGSITWHIDGQPFAAVTRSAVREWVFDQPFYLLLNLAMGGNFAGSIDTHLTVASMHVDYVRHFSLNGVGEVWFQS
jgi:beta-glucanase (GH16 family)